MTMKKMKTKGSLTMKDSKNGGGAKNATMTKIHIVKAKPATAVKDPGAPINGCRPTGQI